MSKWRVIVIFVIVLHGVSIPAFAGQERGGGDPCEQRFKFVRDGLRAWMVAGGPNSLKLPPGISVSGYTRVMKSKMERTKIRCVSQGEDGYPVEIDGTPKVCRFDKTKGGARITCNFVKFSALKASEQFSLVHHEYAGLAGLESPSDDDSTYALSNQIGGFLEDSSDVRLSVTPTFVIPAISEIKLIELNHLSDDNFSCRDIAVGFYGSEPAMSVTLKVKNPFLPADSLIVFAQYIRGQARCELYKQRLSSILPIQLSILHGLRSYKSQSNTNRCGIEDIDLYTSNLPYVMEKQETLLFSKFSRAARAAPIEVCQHSFAGVFDSGSGAVAACSGLWFTSNLYADQAPSVGIDNVRCQFENGMPQANLSAPDPKKFLFSLQSNNQIYKCAGRTLDRLFCDIFPLPR